jgi:phosphoglycerate dehydrogenase-like enzyme
MKMAILPPEIQDEWADQIKEKVPDVEVKIFHKAEDAKDFIQDADCAYGDVVPELFTRAKNLRWIQSYAASPAPSFWHPQLLASDVIVTNFRGIYNDYVAAHAMTFILAFARNLHTYVRQQERSEWKPIKTTIHLPSTTALIIGLGGIGQELAKLCSSLGMQVLGIDLLVKDPPQFVNEVYPPEELDRILPRADFVIIIVPETPQTRRMFTFERLKLMKPTSYLINVGRGVVVVLDDLVSALSMQKIAGAGLDVFETEPLPAASPLWKMPNVIITPHIGANPPDPHIPERRTQILVENARRFSRGEALLNVVDKNNRF